MSALPELSRRDNTDPASAKGVGLRSRKLYLVFFGGYLLATTACTPPAHPATIVARASQRARLGILCFFNSFLTNPPPAESKIYPLEVELRGYILNLSGIIVTLSTPAAECTVR